MDDNIFYETSSSSSSENTVMGSFPAGGILFFIVSLSFLCILTWQSVVKFIQKTCAGSNGSRGCGCFCRRNDRDEDDDDSHGSQEPFEEDGDRILAMELQRQLNEEASESNRMAKRKERRMWYEYYLKPWTMTVKQSDLILEQDHDVDDSSTQPETDEDGTVTIRTGSQDQSEDVSDDEEETDDLEGGESPPMCLRLPESAGGRCVDGTCALCLDNYCEGDQVVWSSCTYCQHAFHRECFLLWLSKGKKRCPICRHWFVPGQKIDDQKILHGKAWTDAEAEMIRAEKEKTKRAAAAAKREELRQQQQQKQQQLQQQNAEATEAAPTTHEANQEPTSSATSTTENDRQKDLKSADSSRTCASESGDSDYYYDCR